MLKSLAIIIAILSCSKNHEFRNITLIKKMPKDFIDLAQIAPEIYQHLYYATDYNFYGKKIPGYEKPICYLHKKAAIALKLINKKLNENHLALIVYDCYRPQRAVNAMYAWAKNPIDDGIQDYFYINERKVDLFKKGYIAKFSGHSQGHTVDVGLVHLPFEVIPNKMNPKRKCTETGSNYAENSILNMGTDYDCFDPLSSTSNSKVLYTAYRNRMLLKDAMEANGFRNYPKEWWHYSYQSLVGDDIYYDFIIK